MVTVDGECRIDEFEEIDEELCDFVSALWVWVWIPTLWRSLTTDSNICLLLWKQKMDAIVHYLCYNQIQSP